ncbi:MAG: M60 family metallopeptidase [Marinifilaceae bacterium]
MKRVLSLLLVLALSASALFAQDSNEHIQNDMQFFTDASCRTLKKGIKERKLKNFQSTLLRNVAEQILSGNFDTTYVAATYKAYLSPNKVGEQLRIGQGFSKYENITGMYLPQGEHIIFLSNPGKHKVNLLIPNWMRKPADGVEPTKDPNGWGIHVQRIELTEGLNRIDAKYASNAYIEYFMENPQDAPRIAVHFPTGKVNGYFDGTTQTEEQWNKLLDNAVSPIMDAKGKHIQVAYPVEWFNTFTKGRGVELIKNYDNMLNMQYTFMGLVKYNRVPENKILARVNFNYYMFRDGDGVAYLGNKGTMNMVANPDVVIKGDPCWGFSHEVGHVLQMRPQLTWGGMTEVSNNLFSLYVAAQYKNDNRIAGAYDKARKEIAENTERNSYLAHGDVFCRLVPFWQLHLYFSQNGNPDFYADVMEAMRTREHAGTGNQSINNQFEFVKICCDIAKLDLTDFFDKWGFFWTGEMKVGDYGNYEYKITEQQVNETKKYIAAKKYAKPTSDLTLTRD